ncbi:hypothetical protein PUN28_006838 [Cardiocondyla obscurior]|uniref:Uncharacterized protein n=1 Tax=Cardiocondyla obscurior TaxID=286306 RepID=A0AAW2G2B3_9HYME
MKYDTISLFYRSDFTLESRLQYFFFFNKDEARDRKLDTFIYPTDGCDKQRDFTCLYCFPLAPSFLSFCQFSIPRFHMPNDCAFARDLFYFEISLFAVTAAENAKPICAQLLWESNKKKKKKKKNNNKVLFFCIQIELAYFSAVKLVLKILRRGLYVLVFC